MKVKDIIADAAEVLGITADKADSNYKILFRCVNLVAANIAGNYIDCTACRTFNVTAGKIEFNKFKNTLLKVKSVKKDGIDVPYELFIDFMLVPNGEVTVTYACVPKFTSGSSNVSLFGNLSGSLLLYGVIAEYANICGMTNEAKVWGERFEQLLFNTGRSGRTRIMPVRGQA